MANALLTPNMITREAVRLWKNTNAFIRNVDMQYSDEFAKTGAKIGTNLRIRLPNDYVVRLGAAASVQDTAEQNTALVVARQAGVDMSFSSLDLTMSIQDFSKRFIAPAVNVTAGQVAYDVMTAVEGNLVSGITQLGGAANYVANVDVSNNVLSPTASTVLQARALLALNSAPDTQGRKLCLSPVTNSRLVSTLSGLYNPATDISKQYRNGMMGNALSFDMFEDQTVLVHTAGTLPASGTANTVSGANQTGSTIVTSALTGTLNIGDFITIAGVYGVNRITKQSTGQLRQFVVTSAAAVGATQISVYPSIVPAVSGNSVQYQTVTASPANGAAIVQVVNAGAQYRKNIAYAPEAITLAFADLELPKGVEMANRVSEDGVSIRLVGMYAIATDQFITRLDVLYGWTITRPEWVVVVADIL